MKWSATHRLYVLIALVGLVIIVVIAATDFVRAGKIIFTDGSIADWPVYGRDHGGTRYSPVDQINRENVSLLEIAWEYHTGDFSDGSDGRQPTSFQATPILVDGVLYVSTAYSRIISLDPETGAELWTYDPGIDRDVHRSEIASRGVTTWLDEQRETGEPCHRRIFIATRDARLIAVDSLTGKPCADFGLNGQIDLSEGVDLGDYTVNRRHYGVTSPPAVIGDLVVVGSAIGDNSAVTLERGLVRAFDARTGELRWFFDPIPRDPDDPARETWEGDSAERTGAANVWAPISADPERNLVFVPTSSPSPDYYGGERLGSNRYADSVVALNGTTGEVVWDYQIVHHNLWDYDLPAQPTLVTVRKDGLEIPAVAQATKMGFLFLLHRDTGKPIFPVEERPVPRSTVPGEQSWPTQPFPTVPPPLAPLTLTPNDAWGLTFWDRGKCRELIERYRYEGIFTPPGFDGTIQYPGILGGTNWGSVAFEPERGLVVLNMTHLPFITKLIPRERYEAERAKRPKNTEFAPQLGTPVGMSRAPLVSPWGPPCTKPPWGTILAVELATGEVTWDVPLGLITGTPNLGGPIVTGGGLVFIGAAMDNFLRAFDVETGEVLWKGSLPAGGQATPMTYRLSENGKQFVVIAAGGHGKSGTPIGDSVVAFALPESRTGVLVKSIKETSLYVGAVLVIAFLLIRFRKYLLSKWLWFGVLVVFVIFSTETAWLMTQSTLVMVLSFSLALVMAFLLMRVRRSAIRSAPPTIGG